MLAAKILGATLERLPATAYLMNNKSPSRKGGEPDNRSTHYWVARYWADALASQADNEALVSAFCTAGIASLADAEAAIMQEMIQVPGARHRTSAATFQPDEAIAVEGDAAQQYTFNALARLVRQLCSAVDPSGKPITRSRQSLPCTGSTAFFECDPAVGSAESRMR